MIYEQHKKELPFIQLNSMGSIENNRPPRRRLPERIILVRHGESQGNLDSSAYSTTADHQIPLTPRGLHQAREAGRAIRRILSSSSNNNCCDCSTTTTTTSNSNWGVYFYASPYERTRSTLRQIGRSFSRRRILGAREECRIREQDFGNFQVIDRMRAVKEARERFGRFFFRFPEGESAADVFDRVASQSPLSSLITFLSFIDLSLHSFLHFFLQASSNPSGVTST